MVNKLLINLNLMINNIEIFCVTVKRFNFSIEPVGRGVY
jgi:hypothetical protein